MFLQASRDGPARWEFLYDIAVVNVEWIDAAFAIKKTVPLIKNAIWLVKSEVADDGTKVGEDASKLRIGRSENTLLIAAQDLRGMSRQVA